MSDREFLLLMLAMGVATYLPRMIPLVMLSRRALQAGLPNGWNLFRLRF